jgi:NAD(P)-dependent dehydrogenase (short-subunit alcohol dehydrogenase family)
MGAVRLTDKRVVITGAARGLGRGFAEAALDAGARVVIADILDDRGRQTAEELSATGEVSILPTPPRSKPWRRRLKARSAASTGL